MFDDNKNSVSPPNDLPVDDAEDMFAGIDKVTDAQPSAPAPDPNRTAQPDPDPVRDSKPVAPKDAISAGVLKPKSDPQSMPVAQNDPTAPQAPVASSTNVPPQGINPDLDKQAGSLNQISKYKMKGPFLGKMFLIIAIVVFLGAIVFGAYWTYTNVFKKKMISTPTIQKKTETKIEKKTKAITTKKDTSKNKSIDNINTTTQINNQIKTDQILFGEPVDSDNDGLDDIREKQLKTDPTKKDTDGDGLSDGDEFFIWKTDPTKKDTDGDTYEDGHEIKNGYNPLGPGKLLNIPTTINTTSTN